MGVSKKLNPRQAAVIKKIAEGKTQTDAYMEVYGVGNDTARANAPRMLAKASTQLARALREKGIDEESIADTLLEIKGNDDWRAKSDYVDKSAKFLGYENKEGDTVYGDKKVLIIPQEIYERHKPTPSPEGDS